MAEIKSEQFINHLKLKWQGRRCPMCTLGNWTVSDKVFELHEFHGGDFVIGGTPLIPVVPVTCDNCGNTVLVNALLSGALEKEGKDDK